MKPLCIAHGSSCVDGFASSWVVHRALGEAVEFVYASYNQDPPDVRDRDVLIVDFSYPRAVLEAMARAARSVLVLDHHKSAAEDLKGLQVPNNWKPWLAQEVDPAPSHEIGNLAAFFDMERSGAGITWDYFFPYLHDRRPWFINLVEDRDLWKFTDDRSRPFHAAVTSYPLDFALWDKMYDEGLPTSSLDCAFELRQTLGTGQFANDLIKEGTGILRKHDLDVKQIIKTTRRTMIIGGVRVPVCNCPPWLASDVGHELTGPEPCPSCAGSGNVGLASPAPTGECTDCLGTGELGVPSIPFAATYYDRDGRRNFSLRSRPAGADVSKVCALYGGGGHHGAGGFERPQGWEGEE